MESSWTLYKGQKLHIFIRMFLDSYLIFYFFIFLQTSKKMRPVSQIVASV